MHAMHLLKGSAMIHGKTRQWDIPTQQDTPASATYATRWSTQVCRECRNEYIRYWEANSAPERLVVGIECFHLTEDQWAPGVRRAVPV